MNYIAVAITITTVLSQSALFAASGGFSAGKQLAEIGSELKLLRTEIVSSNQIQDFRISSLEEKIKNGK
jgi:hypothetical protein